MANYKKKNDEFTFKWTCAPPEMLEELALRWIKWLQAKVKKGEVPYIMDFCFEVWMQQRELKEVITQSKPLQLAYEWALELQEHGLCTNALKRKNCPNFTKFYLNVKHGMKESIDDSKVANAFEEYMTFIKQQAAKNNDTGSQPETNTSNH